MKMRYSLFLVALLAASTLVGCSQQEVPTFSGEVGVNFRERSGDDNWSDGYNFLFSITDLFQYYTEQQTFDITYPESQLSLLIEGPVQDKPLKVKLKLEPLDGYELPDVTLPDEVVIPAGEKSVVFSVHVGKPAKMETRYAGKVTIDYDKSDVVAGTKERQSLVIGIQDIAQLPSQLDGLMTWDEFVQLFESKLGKFGPMKLRLALINDDPSFPIFYHAYYTKIGYDGEGWGYGLGENLSYYADALKEYNDAHPGAPLMEADGTPVTFPEP